MNVLSLAPPPPATLPPLPIHRFTVEQYHRLVPLGLLGADDPVELLEGLIVVKGQSTLVPSVQIADRPGYNSFSQPLPIRRFTVVEYHRLLETGILTEEDRVELLEGWIVSKMTRNPPHEVATVLLGQVLPPLLPVGWHLRVQATLATDSGEPEPDGAIVRSSPRDYLAAHPRPRDVALLTEVADSSLATDRTIKGPGYARLNIPIYWIVNLIDSIVEVYSDPTGPDPEPTYRNRRDFSPGESVPFVIDGQTVARIAVRDLLP